ncbi:histidine-type phosphatase [Sphingomonas sp. RS6]
MKTRLLQLAATAALAFTAPAWADSAPPAAPPPAPQQHIERIVLLMRHGVRTPLHGEVPAGTRTGAPWPRWQAKDEQITPHGAAALRALARADRRWFAREGLLPLQGCPAPASVRVWTNTSPRTIASGAAYAEGLAPGCALAVGHRDADEVDPLFEPLNAPDNDFDARRAVESIERYTGGVDALAERHRSGLTLLEAVLGCTPPAPCNPDDPSALRAGADGRGIDLRGPIRTASGTAQVLMLEYLEGFAMPRVGWGRADARRLQQLGAVHGALFDVFSRPPYMAAFQAGPTAARIARDFSQSDAPVVDMLVGHDTNVAALAALLGVPVKAPGFAAGDPSPGGALAVALVRRSDGSRAVRLWYRSQSAAAIRAASDQVVWTPLRLAGCDEGAAHLCPLPRFLARLEAATAPARR